MIIKWQVSLANIESITHITRHRHIVTNSPPIPRTMSYISSSAPQTPPGDLLSLVPTDKRRRPTQLGSQHDYTLAHVFMWVANSFEYHNLSAREVTTNVWERQLVWFVAVAPPCFSPTHHNNSPPQEYPRDTWQDILGGCMCVLRGALLISIYTAAKAPHLSYGRVPVK